MSTPPQDTPLSDDEQAVVDDWIANADATPRAKDVVRFARYLPELGWRAILAILELPGSKGHLAELAHPLNYIVVKFGDAFIDRIELEAVATPAFRRCLTMLPSDPKFPVPESLWARLSAATGRSIGPEPSFMALAFARYPQLAYSRPDDSEQLPPDDAPVLTDDEVRDDAKAWIVERETVWARDALEETAIQSPLEAWPLVPAIVKQGGDSAVATLGDGVLADLIYGPEREIIDRVEAEAQRSARFRYCLSFVGPRRDAPEIWARVEKARGDEPRRELHPEIDERRV